MDRSRLCYLGSSCLLVACRGAPYVMERPTGP